MTENDVVLEVLEAFNGLVTPDIRAVALDHSGGGFTVYVALARDTPAVQEDLEDMRSTRDRSRRGGRVIYVTHTAMPASRNRRTSRSRFSSW